MPSWQPEAVPPELLENWQGIVDLLARVAGARACLVNRATAEELEIAVASATCGNPYRAGGREPYADGPYCEWVLRHNEQLLVADARASERWRDNPDAVAFGLISYLGFPIRRPGGEPFGTLCLLDDKANEYSADLIAIMEKMRDLIEANLGLLEEARVQRLFSAESITRKILDNLPTPVSCATLEPGSPVVYVNQKFVDTFGYAPAEIPTVDAWFVRAYPDEETRALAADAWRAMLAEARPAGQVPAAPASAVRCKDGSVRTVLLCGAVLDDLVVLSFPDITEQKQSEERLRAAKEQIEATLSASPDLMFRVDREGRILAAHAAEDSLFYVSTDLFLGKTAAAVLPDAAAQVIAEAITAAGVTGSHRGAVYSLHLDGCDTWWELSVAAVGGRLGPRNEFVVLARDITARREVEEALRRRVAELDALRRMAELLVQRVDLTQALQSVREVLLTLYGACAAEVHLLADEYEHAGHDDGFGTCDVGAADASEGVIAAALADAELLTVEADGFQFLAVPLLAQRETVGVLLITRLAEDGAYSPTEQALAQTAGDLLAGVLGLERLHVQEKEAAAGEERRRIARDLHDAVTQSIHSAGMLAEALPTVWEQDPNQGREDMLTIRRLIRAAFAELRILLYELRPDTLAAAPLEVLFERLRDALAGRGETVVDLTLEPGLALPQEVRLAFYRLAQEALNNVGKYAHAGHAVVSLVREGDAVRLTVADDGRGFDPATCPAGMGLGIMRERAAAIGAQLRVASAPGAGTTVTAVWRPPAEPEPGADAGRREHAGSRHASLRLEGRAPDGCS